jgi:hypothetical protein
MLNPYTVLKLARWREAELVREMEMQRLARRGRISRTLRRLVAAGAMHRDSEAELSRSTGGRV